MRHFMVYYDFRKGINGPIEKRSTEVAFDDIDPETTDLQLRRMAEREVNNRFESSNDFPLYGKFWEITEVKEINY